MILDPVTYLHVGTVKTSANSHKGSHILYCRTLISKYNKALLTLCHHKSECLPPVAVQEDTLTLDAHGSTKLLLNPPFGPLSRLLSEAIIRGGEVLFIILKDFPACAVNLQIRHGTLFMWRDAALDTSSIPSGKRAFRTATTGAAPSMPHSTNVLLGCSRLPLYTQCSQGSLNPSSLQTCLLRVSVLCEV